MVSDGNGWTELKAPVASALTREICVGAESGALKTCAVPGWLMPLVVDVETVPSVLKFRFEDQRTRVLSPVKTGKCRPTSVAPDGGREPNCVNVPPARLDPEGML